MSVNSVCISGNLGRDPELRMTRSGMQVCKFSVCVNERRRNAESGEWEDEPNWVDVTFFGKRAEGIHRGLAKGSLVTVQGRLRQNSWTSKDGQKRSKLEVVGDEVQLPQRANGAAQAAPGGGSGYGTGERQQVPGWQEQPDYADGGGIYDDDIRF